jgi:predicted PhzF superfamily epimerase YddE/YHI9
MRLPYHIVDAFADRVFAGNPAAVLKLDRFLPTGLMQSIAAENNLSETAFVVPEGDDWKLRWFTPATEVELCGHATLATAFVLDSLGVAPSWRFHTLSGVLTVTRDAGRLVLDFPAWPSRPAIAPAGLAEALGAAPVEVHEARDWICVFADAATVAALRPDHVRILALPGGRVIATAAGGDGVDVTSRYFAIKAGVAEDPVTGAAHTQLVPFWAARLDRSNLVCRQASARGGTLWCQLAGDRVRMGGTGVLYARGEILLAD